MAQGVNGPKQKARTIPSGFLPPHLRYNDSHMSGKTVKDAFESEQSNLEGGVALPTLLSPNIVEPTVSSPPVIPPHLRGELNALENLGRPKDLNPFSPLVAKRTIISRASTTSNTPVTSPSSIQSLNTTQSTKSRTKSQSPGRSCANPAQIINTNVFPVISTNYGDISASFNVPPGSKPRGPPRIGRGGRLPSGNYVRPLAGFRSLHWRSSSRTSAIACGRMLPVMLGDEARQDWDKVGWDNGFGSTKIRTAQRHQDSPHYDANSSFIRDPQETESWILKWQRECEPFNLTVGGQTLIDFPQHDIVPVQWSFNQFIEGKTFALFYSSTPITRVLLGEDEQDERNASGVEDGDFDTRPFWEKVRSVGSLFLNSYKVPSCLLDPVDDYSCKGNIITTEQRVKAFLDDIETAEKEISAAERVYHFGPVPERDNNDGPPKTYCPSSTEGWGTEPIEISRWKAGHMGRKLVENKEMEVKRTKKRIDQKAEEMKEDLASYLNEDASDDLVEREKEQPAETIPSSRQQNNKVTSTSDYVFQAQVKDIARAKKVLTSKRRQFIIRKAENEDALRIRDIYNQCVESGPFVIETEPLATEDILCRMIASVNSFVDWLVAVTTEEKQGTGPAGTVVGVCYLEKYESNTCNVVTAKSGRLGVLVERLWRGVGIGSALLGYMTKIANPYFKFKSKAPEWSFKGEMPNMKGRLKMMVGSAFYFDEDDGQGPHSRFRRLNFWMEMSGWRMMGDLIGVGEKNGAKLNQLLFVHDCTSRMLKNDPEYDAWTRHVPPS